MYCKDPYLKVGLKRNPFITSELLEVPTQLWLDMGFSCAPKTQDRLLFQIIGKKGAGKTSHLLHWRAQTGGNYYYCETFINSWKIPPVQAIVYWDEADRIPLPILICSLCRARFLNATIVVGTHKDLSLLARIIGLKVNIIKLDTLSSANLVRWAQKAINAVSISSSIHSQLHISLEQAESIVKKSKGSWRIAANHLHILVSDIAHNNTCSS